MEEKRDEYIDGNLKERDRGVGDMMILKWIWEK
jgi:hypothetical protein